MEKLVETRDHTHTVPDLSDGRVKGSVWAKSRPRPIGVGETVRKTLRKADVTEFNNRVHKPGMTWERRG